MSFFLIFLQKYTKNTSKYITNTSNTYSANNLRNFSKEKVLTAADAPKNVNDLLLLKWKALGLCVK